MMYKSEYDTMTAVYNKATLELRVSDRLKTVEGIQTGTFMMLDVDHFKTINDSYGHPFGDAVLIEVARVLRDTFRKQDIIGRLGGDEFGVYFSGMRSIRHIEQSANAICEGIRGIAAPDRDHGRITCSIGISVCDGRVKLFNRIYKEADIALYAVKDHGRNGFALYDKNHDLQDMICSNRL